jgi:lipoprotein-releasing system permease protein
MIETAIQMQSRYVVEIRKQMGVLLLIFGMVSLSAVLLVFCILYMIVETRRKDISIIKSCGASGCSVAMVFLGFGAVVGIAGAAVGTGLGYIVTKNINAIEHSIGKLLGLKLWKSSVYMLSRIPDSVDWAGAAPIVIAAIAAAAVGALIPAIIAARTNPVDILRYE